MEEIARETQGIKVGTVNVDEEPILAEAFQLISIPALALMKDGRQIYLDGGVKRKEEIIAILARWVD